MNHVFDFLISHVKDGYTVMFWEREDKQDLTVVDEYGYCYFQDLGLEDLLPVTIYSNMETIEHMIKDFILSGCYWEVV